MTSPQSELAALGYITTEAPYRETDILIRATKDKRFIETVAYDGNKLQEHWAHLLDIARSRREAVS